MYIVQKFLQQYFLNKRANNFKELILNDENNFKQDNLESFLLDKSKLIITENFLLAFQNLENFYLSGGQYQKRSCLKKQNGFFLDARNFLAILSINYNPNLYFNNSHYNISKKNLEDKLLEICSTIVSLIKNSQYNLTLLKSIRIGIQLFREWKNIDHKELINHQIISYWEMEFEVNNLKKSLDENKLDISEYQAISEIIRDSQNKILSYLKQISPQSVIDIKNGKIKPLFLDIQKIQDTFKKAFWDQLREQLREMPPNYTGTLDLLKEIRDLLIGLTPNRLDIQEKVRNELDIELFSQMVRNNAFELSDLENVVMYLVEKINNYQSHDMDKDWLKWKLEVKKDLTQIKNQELNLDIFLPNFFEKYFSSLELIQQKIKDLSNTF